MASTELLRSTLEEIELIEEAIVDAFASECPSDEHIIRFLLDRHSELSKQALTLLDDPVRLEQVAQLGGSDPVAAFDAEISALSARIDATARQPQRRNLRSVARAETRALRRQRCGGVLDLHAQHKEWLSIRKLQDFRKKEFANILWERKLRSLATEPTSEYREAFFAARKQEQPPVDLISYLIDICDFRSVPRYIKYSDPAWLRYLQSLLAALDAQCRIFLPLFDVAAGLAEAADQFERQWPDALPDWGDSGPTWKSELYVPDRLFANANVMKHQKFPGATEQLDDSAKLQSELRDKELAQLECLVAALHRVLPFPTAIQELQRRQAAGEPLTAAAAAAAAEDASESESEEGQAELEDERRALKANPLELPLGLDGKPIPYWLYKLHGLGIEHECEICGNFRYKGARAFELHFQEARHTEGLRLLGIANSRVFKDVVKIEEAVSLAQRLTGTQAAKEPEFEDSLGNVLSRRDYLDLLKQGLL